MAKKAALFGDFNTAEGSYNLFENAMRKAIDFDAYDSDIFEAKVLTVPTLITTALLKASKTNVSSSSIKTYACMVRIRGQLSTHKFLRDPCSIEDAMGPEARRKVFNLIQQHTKVFIYNDGEPLPKIGEIIEVRLERGSFGSFKADSAQFIGVKAGFEQANVGSRDECTSVIQNFESGDFEVRSIESYARIAPPSSAALDKFLNKLKTSGFFGGFSDNFLLGLAANAWAESAFDPKAAGDPRDSTAGGSAKAILATYKGKTTNWCSFGYWQLNVCPEIAQGTAFIKHFKLGENKVEILIALRDEEKQFQFVAKKMEEIFPTEHKDPDISPYDAAHAITIKFENPSDAPNKAIQRGNLAKELAGQK